MKKNKLIFILIIFICIYFTFEIFRHNNIPKFEDYIVEKKYEGKIADVKIDSTSSAKMFKTALTYSAQNTVNFAGHYIVATFGCGSNCQDNMIIDAISGDVYDPFEEPTSRGLEYRSDSNLIIINPVNLDSKDEVINEIPVQYFIWKDNKLVNIYK